MRRILLLVLPLTAFLGTTCGFARAADPLGYMVEATLRGERIEGSPVLESGDRVFLMGRDGRLWDFHRQEAENYHKTASYFSPYSATDIEGRLEVELGRRVEVTWTGHYLVAHPAGQGAVWAGRFEQMYREAIHYFGVRGIATRQPEFPLVAIVFTRQDEFQHYAVKEGTRISSNVLGYYSPRTNRVALFDIGAGQDTASDWRQNAATVVHETAHQVAFNTGVHNRLAPTPRWLAEGIGTLFEARGIWNSEQFGKQSDRINRGRLADFKKYAASRRKPGSLRDLVASDHRFEQEPVAAYSECWALTFYLSETQPGAYAEYVAKTAARRSFVAYPAAERLADFQAVFGDDWTMLDARLLRFVNELR